MGGKLAPHAFTSEERSFRRGLKSAVFIGTLLGVFPRNGVFSNQKSKKLPCHGKVLLLYSVLLTIVSVMNALLKVTKYLSVVSNAGLNFMEKLGESIHSAYASAVAFAYLSQLCHAKHFEVMIGNLYAGIHQLGPGCLGKRPSQFAIFCWAITLACLLFGIGENTLFDMQSYAIAKQKYTNISILLFHHRASQNWHYLLPTFSPVPTLALLIPLKVANYGWVFLDGVVIMLCHTLSSYFRWLHEAIQSRLLQCPPLFKNAKMDVALPVKVQPLSLDRSTDCFTWDKALHLYWLLEDLTSQVEKYVAPLVLACYVCIGHILIILFAWIAPDIPVSLSISNSETVKFSWMYYCFRVGIVTYFLSQVHQSSSEILRTVERCGSSEYHSAAQKLERKLIGNPVGIRLFGSFHITRYFIISMISCVVTSEIILLQIGGAIRPQK